MALYRYGGTRAGHADTLVLEADAAGVPVRSVGVGEVIELTTEEADALLDFYVFDLVPQEPKDRDDYPSGSFLRRSRGSESTDDNEEVND